MRVPDAPWHTAVLLAALSATACASQAGVATTPPPSTGSVAELEAIARARRDSARLRYTDADVRFMTGMIAHHAQALVMAGLAPTHAASPSVRILAARIINAQQDEIATMQQWLRDRGEPVPDVDIRGTRMTVHGAEHANHMPGMLSAEQMRQLDEAHGPAFDRLFLTFMIQHHRGAVVMVHELFATDGAAQDGAVFKLASDVQVDQMTEIDRMERMLAALSEGRAP